MRNVILPVLAVALMGAAAPQPKPTPQPIPLAEQIAYREGVLQAKLDSLQDQTKALQEEMANLDKQRVAAEEDAASASVVTRKK